MTDDPFFYPHRVLVRDYEGRTGTGLSWGEPREIPAEVNDEQKLVRDSSGIEVVSSTQVTVPLDAAVPVRSYVNAWPDVTPAREAEVIAVERNENTDAPDLDSFLVLSLK